MSCQGKPLPEMFTPREYDNTVIGNFLKKKHYALSELIGKQESLYYYYSISDFEQLIDAIASTPNAGGVRIYFASYCSSGAPEIDALVQSGFKDLLTLLFAPTDSNKTDLGPFYLIKPGGGLTTVPLDTADAMVSAYQKIKIPFLQEIIYKSGITDFRETKSMWYSLPKLNGPFGILAEMKDQGADGIVAILGTYAKDYAIQGVKVGWQMTVVFELTSSILFDNVTYRYSFDIEDTGGFCERPPCPTNPSTGSASAMSVFSPNVTDHIFNDTSVPCPPAAGCSGSSVPQPPKSKMANPV